MESKPTLKIEIPEHYQIIYEEPQNFVSSPFHTSYDKAKELIEEITAKQELLIEKEQKNLAYQSSDCYNNIIAFTGERGIGKSSTMLSFKNALISNQKNQILRFNDVNFITLEDIDPSLFRGDESIFEMVLAQMFRKFKQKLEQQIIQIDDDERRNLIFHFQKVYDTFKITKKNNGELYSEESLDNLINLAKGSNLKTSFNELVKSFTKCIGGKGKNKLIITIDDFDLKTNDIRGMLEDIRQLLINNNAIILLAYKSDQLQDILKRSLSKEVEGISDRNSKIDANDIENQSFKYLEKVLPNKHVINLLSSDQEEIYKYLKNVTGYSNKISDNEDTKRFSKISNEIILDLVFEKLDVYISKKSQTNSILYTPNLRSLNELLLSIKDKNLSSFKKYIERTFNTLLDKELIEQIWSCDPILVNTLTLHYCLKHFTDNLSKEKDTTISIRPITSHHEILERLTKATNYSMIQFGDVVSFFKILKDNISITDQNYIHFQAIKLIYNLRRKELIDSSPNYIRTSSLSGIIQASYLNDNQRISKHQNSKKYRDSYLVKSEPPYAESDSIFIQSLGKESLFEYLNSNMNPYDIEKNKNSTFKHFIFNIYNYEYIFSLKNTQQTTANNLLILSQNTDFVIDIYEEIINHFDNITKNNKTGKELEYHQVLNELENIIKKTILPKYGIEGSDLITSEENSLLTTHFKNYVNDSQGTVNKITDIHYIEEKAPFLEIISALERTKSYATLADLFKNIDNADLNIKKYLSSSKFISQITSTNKEGGKSTALRKELKDRLIELTEYNHDSPTDEESNEVSKTDQIKDVKDKQPTEQSEAEHKKEDNKNSSSI